MSVHRPAGKEDGAKRNSTRDALCVFHAMRNPDNPLELSRSARRSASSGNQESEPSDSAFALRSRIAFIFALSLRIFARFTRRNRNRI